VERYAMHACKPFFFGALPVLGCWRCKPAQHTQNCPDDNRRGESPNDTPHAFR
jgi:hypothetical protein